MNRAAFATVPGFYDSLAAHYHLLFDDWNVAIDRQARVLNPLVVEQLCGQSLKVLDCACGIGTQAIGFAKFGHQVTASDLSHAAVTRAMVEAERRALQISFRVSDMTSLAEISENDFDVVAALDNALPHLSGEQVGHAVTAMSSKLKPGGLFVASIRDYDAVIEQRPTIQSPAFYGAKGERRIVHQVWDWNDAARYVLHLYITVQSNQAWQVYHFVSQYRCLLRHELSNALHSAGFEEIRWLMPPESGYYQPMVLARRGS